ncbi:MAG: GGDEF domain-containing protein, partial [Baekduiaceae bacterium]
ASSIREGDLLYRLGGDEFLVLLPATPTSEAADLAERLRATVAARRPAGPDVTLSAGVAGVIHQHVDLEHLISRADRALYAAKQDGRDQVQLAEPDGAPAPTAS